MLSKIPEEVREHVKMLLSVTANVRPDADQVTKVRSCSAAARLIQLVKSLMKLRSKTRRIVQRKVHITAEIRYA